MPTRTHDTNRRPQATTADESDQNMEPQRMTTDTKRTDPIAEEPLEILAWRPLVRAALTEGARAASADWRDVETDDECGADAMDTAQMAGCSTLASTAMNRLRLRCDFYRDVGVALHRDIVGTAETIAAGHMFWPVGSATKIADLLMAALPWTLLAEAAHEAHGAPPKPAKASRKRAKK